MDKKNKNPLLAGLINVLIPGASQLYVNTDRARFFRSFLMGAGAFVVAIMLGNLIQNTRGYSLPQGVCMGSALTLVAVILFISGLRVAGERNSQTDNAAYYKSMRRDGNAAKQTAANKAQTEGSASEQKDAEPKQK